MTYGDIIVKVVAEITREPVDKVREVIRYAFESVEKYSAFTDELTPDDTWNAIHSFRRDPSEILSLYAATKGNLQRQHDGLENTEK